MTKIKNNVSTIKYELNRLVCTQDEIHFVIPNAKDTQVEVVPQTYNYFKVNVVNKIAPGKLLISYLA